MFREIRRKDRLVSNEAGIEMMNRCDFGVLSVLGDDGYPYGVPLNFAYADNCIYAHGFLSGHKIDAIKKHPKVCFTAATDVEVLKDQISTNYTSVIAFGKAEVVLPQAGDDVRQAGFTALMDKYIPNEKDHTEKYIRDNEKNTALIKIDIEHMTCKQRNIK